jgi:predicted unusual protein kinase regulating ubiquinone biosynthesis (AarF/ABC1/UbiB family)
MVLDSEKIARYKNIVRLILKYGTKDFKGNGASAEEEEVEKRAESFAKELESLGPTFIKLGQILSTRPDFIPPQYIRALSRLQDNVRPFSFEEVEQIIEKELKVKISKAFSEFKYEPLAAASLGQVHFARMRDGRPVAVKVQSPDIKDIVFKDFEALEEISRSVEGFTDLGRVYSFQNILSEFKRTLLMELDYRREAANLIKLKENLAEYRRIIIPDPIADYTTESVLTMDFVKGEKVSSLSSFSRLGFNGKDLAIELFKAYLDQILSDGFFHADPHPGNVFVTEDKNLALIDLGMVARVDPEMRDNLLKLLLYIAEGKGMEAARLSLKMSVKIDEGNEENYVNQISGFLAAYQDEMIENIRIGDMILNLTKIAADNGIKVQSELSLLGKTLLSLDEITKILHPGFKPNEELKKHIDQLFRKQMMRIFRPGNIFSSVMDINEFIQKLPGRLNNILDSLTRNKFQLKIDALDDVELMHNLQKIANRITIGLILSSLIIGAALMMQVQTKFIILGYPGLAIIFFILAAVGGCALVFNILKDRLSKRNGRRGTGT